MVAAVGITLRETRSFHNGYLVPLNPESNEAIAGALIVLLAAYRLFIGLSTEAREYRQLKNWREGLSFRELTKCQF